ncbi:hypothetical protein HN51_006463, partial [Arachis hypogaea]
MQSKLPQFVARRPFVAEAVSSVHVVLPSLVFVSSPPSSYHPAPRSSSVMEPKPQGRGSLLPLASPLPSKSSSSPEPLAASRASRRRRVLCCCLPPLSFSVR